MDDRYPVAPEDPVGPRPRGVVDARAGGPRIGPVELTPTRIMLLVAVVGSVAFMAYAVSVRESTQIPLLGAGLAVLGLVFAALAVSGVVSTYRAGVDGYAARAMILAILAGIAAILSLGCFAFAIVGAMVTQAP